MVTRGFFRLVVKTSKFSGKLLGRIHHIPSVSNSKGRLEWELKHYEVEDLYNTLQLALHHCTLASQGDVVLGLMILPNLFYYLSCFSDNVSTSVAHYPSHLHGVPPSTVKRERERGSNYVAQLLTCSMGMGPTLSSLHNHRMSWGCICEPAGGNHKALPCSYSSSSQRGHPSALLHQVYASKPSMKKSRKYTKSLYTYMMIHNIDISEAILFQYEQ